MTSSEANSRLQENLNTDLHDLKADLDRGTLPLSIDRKLLFQPVPLSLPSGPGQGEKGVTPDYFP